MGCDTSRTTFLQAFVHSINAATKELIKQSLDQLKQSLTPRLRAAA